MERVNKAVGRVQELTTVYEVRDYFDEWHPCTISLHMDQDNAYAVADTINNDRGRKDCIVRERTLYE